MQCKLWALIYPGMCLSKLNQTIVKGIHTCLLQKHPISPSLTLTERSKCPVPGVQQTSHLKSMLERFGVFCCKRHFSPGLSRREIILLSWWLAAVLCSACILEIMSHSKGVQSPHRESGAVQFSLEDKESLILQVLLSQGCCIRVMEGSRRV